jgi:hypothetical protein
MIRIVGAAVLFACVPGVHLFAQQPSVKVDVPLMSVGVTVKFNGVEPLDLEKEDFVILEDGMEQTIDQFEPPGLKRTLFLFAGTADPGGWSMAAERLVKALVTSSDETGWDNAATARHVEQELAFMMRPCNPDKSNCRNVTKAVAAIRNWLQWTQNSWLTVPPGSESQFSREGVPDFYGMLQRVVGKLGSLGRHDRVTGGLAPSQWRFVVFVQGDRYQSGSPAAFEALTGIVRQSLAPMFFFVTAREPISSEGFSDLRLLAEISRGHLVVSERPEDTARTANDLSPYLVPRYTLAYAPKSPPDGTPHKVEVRFTGNAMLQKTAVKDRAHKLEQLEVELWQSRTGYTADR